MSSLNDSIRKLTPVRRGDSIYKAASSDRLNAIQDAIKSLARGDNIVTRNIRRQLGSNQVSLSVDQVSGRRGIIDQEFPFQVISRDNGGELQLGVISNSHLFNSEDRNTYEESNDDWGLLDDTGTTGWFNEITVGNKIWLKITLNPEDQAITAIDVEHGPAWDGYPDPININTDDPDNPYQEFFYQIIAEITDPEEDPREGLILSVPLSGDPPRRIQVTQLLSADLMMTTAQTTSDADEPGLSLLVAIPWVILPGTSIDGNANEIPSENNLMTPWQLGSNETANDYNFELFNASEPGAAKVLILDGVVYGPNNDGGVDPDGMPSDDTFTLDVADADEIWLEIDWSPDDPPTIISASIANGETTPDDTEETTYITIGNVSVDDSGDIPIVNCRNELCGDASIELPPYPDSDSFVLEAKDGDLIWQETVECPCGSDGSGGTSEPGSTDGGSPFMPGGGTFGGGGAGSSW